MSDIVTGDGWLIAAKRRDLRNLDGGRGNGPFRGQARGVVLHVNASGKGSQGTSPDWYAAGGGPDDVCPNFQVMADGTIWQFLPIDCQPWTQMNGNSWGPSIETGGDPSEPLTLAQLAACALIYRACHEVLGVPFQLADSPSGRGLGTHGMGGAAWGGHTGCPGPIRASQRAQILQIAQQQQNPDDPNGGLTVAQINDIMNALENLQKDVDHLTQMVGTDALYDQSQLKQAGGLAAAIQKIGADVAAIKASRS